MNEQQVKETNYSLSSCELHSYCTAVHGGYHHHYHHRRHRPPPHRHHDPDRPPVRMFAQLEEKKRQKEMSGTSIITLSETVIIWW